MATIQRLPKVLADSGKSRTSLYEDISSGLWPRPIKLGRRAVGWPEHESNAVIRARIAGKSPEQIRALVAELEAARKLAA